MAVEDCSRKRDAKSEAGRLREILDKGKLTDNPKKKRLPYLTFSEVANELDKFWLEKLSENDLSSVTYDGYKLGLGLLEKVFGRRLLYDITGPEIKAFRIAQFHESSAATANRNLFVLKQVFKFGVELRAAVFDVCKDIRYLNKNAHERTRFIKLFRSKNTQKRTEFLMSRTREALLGWKDHLTWMRKRKRILTISGDNVFCRLNGVPTKRFDSAWRNVCRIAGVKSFHYHDLRHTFCFNLILSGSDLKVVKEMIGYRDLSTTDRYSHLTSSS